MKYKSFYIIVSLLLSGSLCACTTTQSQDATDTSSAVQTPVLDQEADDSITVFTLPYTQSDSFNPYQAQSINNLAITPLLFNNLVTIDPDFSLDYHIADSISFSDSTMVVHIRDGLSFTDGSALTAKDVVYSFNKAKLSSNYQAQLSSLLSATGTDDTVVFTMSSPNRLAGYLLDFPIVKKQSAEGTDTPIGSGRYLLNLSSDNGTLQYNTNYFQHASPKFTEIQLESSPDPEATEAGIKIGWYDLAYRGTSENTMGGTGAIVQSTPITQLLYIGINESKAPLSNPQVRQALSTAIDREELLRYVYSDNGLPTTLPIYPSMPLENSPSPSTTDIEQANALLDQVGITRKDSYGARYLDGKPLSLEILVPQSNSYDILVASTISTMLSNCGIQTKIVPVNDEQYLSRIASGNYTLYIGEIQQTKDCSLTPFFTGGSASYGLAQSESLQTAYQNFLSNTDQFSAFASEFNQQMPFIPLCYRNGTLVHSSHLTSDIQPSASDIFYNIVDWE